MALHDHRPCVAAIDKTFRATLIRSPAPGGWTYIETDWTAGFFGTRGLVKVAGTIDGTPFEGSFMALGNGHHKLPVKAGIRKAIGKGVGDAVTFHLLERR